MFCILLYHKTESVCVCVCVCVCISLKRPQGMGHPLHHTSYRFGDFMGENDLGPSE